MRAGVAEDWTVREVESVIVRSCSGEQLESGLVLTAVESCRGTSCEWSSTAHAPLVRNSHPSLCLTVLQPVCRPQVPQESRLHYRAGRLTGLRAGPWSVGPLNWKKTEVGFDQAALVYSIRCCDGHYRVHWWRT